VKWFRWSSDVAHAESTINTTEAINPAPMRRLIASHLSSMSERTCSPAVPKRLWLSAGRARKGPLRPKARHNGLARVVAIHALKQGDCLAPILTDGVNRPEQPTASWAWPRD
jgi:hypothetical protein